MEKCPDARDEIGLNEKRTPTFALPHVRTFVLTGSHQAFPILPDHYVTQRHRGNPTPKGQRSQEQFGDGTVYFDDLVIEETSGSDAPSREP